MLSLIKDKQLFQEDSRNSYERLNEISKTIYGIDTSYFNSNDNLLIPYGTRIRCQACWSKYC